MSISLHAHRWLAIVLNAINGVMVLCAIGGLANLWDFTKAWQFIALYLVSLAAGLAAAFSLWRRTDTEVTR